MDPNFTELSSLTYVGPYGHRKVQEYFMKQTTQWSIRAVEIRERARIFDELYI